MGKGLKLFFSLAVIMSLMVTAQNLMYRPLGKMAHIVTIIWYNFDDVAAEGEWELTVSKFGIKDPKKTKLNYYDHVPSGLGDVKKDSKKSLGFHTSFNRKGYNWIDLKPVKERGPFPGHVKSMDMWVWGGNFNYTLEAHIEDHSGYLYKLPMGRLMYYGWRNLSLLIPQTIPQSEPYAPRQKGITFKKFRLYSAPNERKDRFHCFFDYFKIVTDAYRNQYDGYELEKIISDELGEGPGKLPGEGGASPSTTTGP